MESEVKDEVDTLIAIYGDELVQFSGRSIIVTVNDTNQTRCILLTLELPEGYPNAAPEVALEGKRGVKHEQLLKLRNVLQQETQQCLGMPMVFSLAEKLKADLDGLDGASSVDDDEAASGNNNNNNNFEMEKPKSHQVGSPLIIDGTRCTENVFLAWREKWMEERAIKIAERERQKALLAESKPTGKQLFLRGMATDEGLAHNMIDSILTEVPVDESLFKNVDVSNLPDE